MTDGADIAADRDLLGALNVAENGNEPVAAGWLERASDLLAEPDPGPTPWLVEHLLVEGSIGAVQGAPKCGKTWAVLEVAVAVVTGRPAFGRFEVPRPGPAILVLEESGRKALHRRLDPLARGNAIRPGDLAGLHFAANRRVRLDDPTWQGDLLSAVQAIRPAVVLLDPLARLKSPGRDENSQLDVGPLLDFMRLLRDEAPGPCAVVFVHHTGHDGLHLRGSSDLESYWESKLTLKKAGDETTFSAEHREAEASDSFRFRQAWDNETRSVRLRLVDDERQEGLVQRVAEVLDEHPDWGSNDVYKALGGNRQRVLAAVAHVRGEQVVPATLVPPGTTPPGQPAGGSEAGGLLRSRSPAGNHREQVVPDTSEPPDFGTASLDELEEHFGGDPS